MIQTEVMTAIRAQDGEQVRIQLSTPHVDLKVPNLSNAILVSTSKSTSGLRHAFKYRRHEELVFL